MTSPAEPHWDGTGGGIFEGSPLSWGGVQEPRYTSLLPRHLTAHQIQEDSWEERQLPIAPDSFKCNRYIEMCTGV